MLLSVSVLLIFGNGCSYHLSAVVVLTPMHSYLSSTVHIAEHPSPSSLVPSSDFSNPALRFPSPLDKMQILLPSMLTLQAQSSSTLPLLVHPSPVLIFLPSSQSSLLMALTSSMSVKEHTEEDAPTHVQPLRTP